MCTCPKCNFAQTYLLNPSGDKSEKNVDCLFATDWVWIKIATRTSKIEWVVFFLGHWVERVPLFTVKTIIV